MATAKKVSAAKRAAVARKPAPAAKKPVKKRASAAKKTAAAAKVPAKKTASAVKKTAAKRPAVKKRASAARQSSRERDVAEEAPVAELVARAWARIEAGRFAGRLRPGRAAEKLDLDIASDSEVSLPEEYWAFVGRHDGEAPGEARGVVAGFRLLAHDEGREIDTPEFYEGPASHADVRAAISTARSLAATRFAAILDRKRPRPDPRIVVSSIEWTLAVGSGGARIVLMLPVEGHLVAQVVHYDVDGRATLLGESLLAWMEALPIA